MGRKEEWVTGGSGQSWVPPQLRSRSPAPAQSPHCPSQSAKARPGPAPPLEPLLPSSSHTHWFSSRSRVKLELKAGMTKLTWARWTGWGWGEGRGRVNLGGKSEGGNWGIGGTPEQGGALGKGGPSAASVWTTDLGGRCFARDAVLSLGSAHPWAQPTLPTGSGHSVQRRGRCQPTLSGVSLGSSQDGEGSWARSLSQASPTPMLAGPPHPQKYYR